MCGYVCVYILYVCVYLYSVGYTCICVHVWVYERVIMFMCACGCVVQRFRPVWWNSDPLREIRFGARYEPIHWRFEDRPMGWSEDSYRFMQWRPHGDSVPKRRHFMWVFALVHFLIYSYQCCLYITCIISYDHLLYYTSMITCTISYDISECTLSFYSLSNAYHRHFMW